MDVLMSELEFMSSNIEVVTRWQELFRLTFEEANQAIQIFRLDHTIRRLTNEEWIQVKEEQEELGHDKESYEYFISKIQVNRSAKERSTAALFLFILNETFPTATSVREFMGLDQTPATFSGTDDADGRRQFCRVNAETRQQMLNKFPTKIFDNDFIPDSFADKTLCPLSLGPTLGIDSTLPQYRLSAANATALPQQEDYPVYYFFYGTLADPAYLTRLLHLAEAPKYRAARIRGGKLTTWGGKYMALVDEEGGEVYGQAYSVRSREDETRLQYYETNKYEVVRTKIEMYDDEGSQFVPGLTFRFVG